MREAQDASIRLAEFTSRRLQGLWALHQSGDLALDEFRAQAGAVIAAANEAGVQLADLAVSAEVARQLRTLRAPLGLSPSRVQTDPRRIISAVDSAISDPAVAPAELDRLGRSEPLLTVALAVQTAMAGHGARGWRRQTDTNPCPQCVAWDDGVVRPVGTRMARHLGCACVQQPVFR